MDSKDYLASEDTKKADRSCKNRDEVALDLMKFIAMTTGYGKGAGGAGFTGKTNKTPEEHAEALIELFERCRGLVGKD